MRQIIRVAQSAMAWVRHQWCLGSRTSPTSTTLQPPGTFQCSMIETFNCESSCRYPGTLFYSFNSGTIIENSLKWFTLLRTGGNRAQVIPQVLHPPTPFGSLTPALPLVLFLLDGRERFLKQLCLFLEIIWLKCRYTTFWQYGTSDNTDVDKFNGDSDGLKRYFFYCLSQCQCWPSCAEWLWEDEVRLVDSRDLNCG